MKKLIAPLALVVCSGVAFGQSLIVTAEGRHGAAPSEVTKDQVSVELRGHPARIEEWTPLRGDRAALDLYVVIDDGLNTDIGNQFNSLKSFMEEQPASTRIGLAYLRNGAALIAAPLTSDHEQVESALRLPLGMPGISGSPYISLAELIKKWPSTGVRREILVISNGMDPYSPADPLNPYLLNTIAAAQRGGILVHSIYYGGGRRLGVNWGVNYLSELGDETGGKAYWQGSGSPVLFDSFLEDFNQRLNNQYLLRLEAGDAKIGPAAIKITASNPDATLTAAKEMWIARQPD